MDTETGAVTVLRLSSAYDVGRVLNPALVQGQITGGAVIGMAHALYETTQPYYPSIDHMPGSFADYLLPGPWELPEIESTVLEYPSGNGPFGAKGVDEMTANSPIPAIISASGHGIKRGKQNSRRHQKHENGGSETCEAQ